MIIDRVKNETNYVDETLLPLLLLNLSLRRIMAPTVPILSSKKTLEVEDNLRLLLQSLSRQLSVPLVFKEDIRCALIQSSRTN